ncbi:MAG: hypothetical protein EBU33_00475 [Sphingobacteriia bacterium]|nr:hypothetical protein [Sphingobacteriia bacterium]
MNNTSSLQGTTVELPSSMDLLNGASNFDQTIQSANTARFYPSGSTTFSDSNRNISIRLSSSDYIRPQTATLLFTLALSNCAQVPEDLFAVQMLGNITLECGGRVVENIQNAGMCLYPIIVHKTPASVYRSTLSVSGGYKYKPSYSHYMQFSEKGVQTKLGQDMTAPYVLEEAQYGPPATNSWFRTPRDGTASGGTPPAISQDEINSVQFRNSRGVLSPGSATASDIVNYLHTISDYFQTGNHVSFCKADSDDPGVQNTDYIGLDFSEGVKIYTDTSQSNISSYKCSGSNLTNSQSIGSLVCANSMPIHNQPSSVYTSSAMSSGLPPIGYVQRNLQWGSLGLGHPIEAEGERTRTYALYLKDILGIFNSPRLLPLRNCGSMVLNIQLRPYQEMFLHVAPSNAGWCMSENSPAQLDGAGVGLTQEFRDVLNNTTLPYTISNVRLTVDTVRPADSFVQKVDEMCAGNEGLSIVYSSRETSITPVAYATNIQITSTRAYSYLKTIYTSFQESLTSQSVFLSKSDRYLGSRFIRSNTVIGSTTYPLINIESASEAFVECKKACIKPDALGTYPEDSVIDYQIYTGKRSTLGTSDSFVSSGLFPSLVLAKTGKTFHKLKQSSQAHTQAPSCFLLAQNVDRVLQSGCTFSGLSTRTSGFSITTNIDMREFIDAPPRDQKGYSITSSAFIDAHLGNCMLRACTVFEFDCLLRLANSSVEVRN